MSWLDLRVSRTAATVLALLILVPAGGVAGAGPAGSTPDSRWTRQFGTTESVDVWAIAVDRLGRSYVVGSTSGTLAGAGNHGGSDAYVRAYGGDGRLRWTRQFGTAANDRALDVAVDGDGDIAVVGDTSGKLSGAKQGGEDAWVRVYRSDGSLAWGRQFGSGENDEARGVGVDQAGNVYVAGETAGRLAHHPFGDVDVFLRKYSPTGVVRWTRQYGTPFSDYVDGAAVDAKGDAWVIGGTTGDLGQTNAGGFDAVIRGYDTTGRLRWTRQLGTTADDFASDAEADADGNLLVVGSTDGAMPDGGSDPGGTDVVVFKLSPSGDLRWTRQFGSGAADLPSVIDVDGDGNAFVGGSTLGALLGQDAVDAWDAFVGSFSPGGAQRWGLEFGAAGDDGILGIAVRRVDEVYLAGQTETGLNAPTVGASDGFVRRLAPR